MGASACKCFSGAAGGAGAAKGEKCVKCVPLDAAKLKQMDVNPSPVNVVCKAVERIPGVSSCKPDAKTKHLIVCGTFDNAKLKSTVSGFGYTMK